MIEYDPPPFYKTRATKAVEVVVEEPVVVEEKLVEEPLRTRDEEGKFIADDPKTADVNEAWTTGKSPAKHKK